MTGIELIGLARISDREHQNTQMPGDITFATDSSAISPNFNPVLNDVALVVNKYDKTILMIEGHTDDTGSESYNQQLSERRANAVENQLMAYNVNSQRITTVGLGEYQPKVSNTSAENRQMNRRVELSIEPITQ